MLAKGSLFYRVRVNPQRPAEPDEYDCPPLRFVGRGRLDSTGFGVMYGSQDLDICIHECRVTAEDDIYVATLQPTKDLRLLDLTALLDEDEVTEYESLDIAVHMLFLASSHACEITRKIAIAAGDSASTALSILPITACCVLAVFPLKLYMACRVA
ncbi:RES domain-containing protein [Caballeronia sp. LZ032]|nr:RES domain-containing protein [Caballeronia sp. LZ032]MDR5877491.1 RES domain-containing protein [Caballeronia sp. LZ032]